MGDRPEPEIKMVMMVVMMVVMVMPMVMMMVVMAMTMEMCDRYLGVRRRDVLIEVEL